MKCDCCHEENEKLKEIVVLESFSVHYYICEECWSKWRVTWLK